MESNVAAEKTVLDIIKDINQKTEVSLVDTVDLVNNKDYKIRFVAEYMQAKIRYNSLHKMIIKKEAGTLEYELTCPLIILQNQISYMGQYIKVLEIRAEIEKIPLPKI